MKKESNKKYKSDSKTSNIVLNKCSGHKLNRRKINVEIATKAK